MHESLWIKQCKVKKYYSEKDYENLEIFDINKKWIKNIENDNWSINKGEINETRNCNEI